MGAQKGNVMTDKLKELLIEVLQLPSGELSDDMTMETVEEWDSLRHMELIVAVEETFNFELTGDEIASMGSIGGIRKIVEAKVA
jgi:acyl carrier protein